MTTKTVITADITGVKYQPLICRKLNTFSIEDLEKALSKEASFILKIDKEKQVAVSWWVSSKRTRSYPYARVYDCLSFAGKKITIIPIVKDEGMEGDRDFLQWDTVSLMSLLGIYVIISYYKKAERSSRYKNKITNQRFDVEQIKSEVKKLLSYQSDPLHWNLEQINKVSKLGQKAMDAYDEISKILGVRMHSKDFAKKKIADLMKDKETFMKSSRRLAEMAQKREVSVTHSAEKLTGSKATITIKNYLGGYYYFTADEAKINKNQVELVEGKNTKENKLPALEDIKDGLLKMILFSNLENVKVNGEPYNPIPVLKLTTGKELSMKNLNNSQSNVLELLKKEAINNGFKILLNDKFIT